MKKVVLATNNTHKADEIRAILDFPGWEFLTLNEAGICSDPEEDADTFLGNARIKALAAHKASGMAALADDSGLEVDALDGAPGVFSARYAGSDADDAANNQLLLKNLEGIDSDKRTARFVCTLVFIDEDGTELVSRGTVEGAIGFSERGSQGFGYDPLFLPNEYNGQKTLAEVAPSEKNSISHRARALQELRNRL